jgi:formylglycine-generating enzyme required for sulfatase activity
LPPHLSEDKALLHIEQPFLLSRYPVTNSQYRAFVEDGGYRNCHWWSATGWEWLQQKGVTEPAYWTNHRWNGPNQPVIGVSFWEAEACCRWAGGRLPTEHEWEAAARGPDGCEYPWCGEWEDSICNSDAAGLGVISAVGLFPRSRRKALGIEDLTGNVLEWCDRKEGEGGGAPRVLRCGAFLGGSRDLRSSGRDGGDPEFRVRVIGFRCVLAPHRQP